MNTFTSKSVVYSCRSQKRERKEKKKKNLLDRLSGDFHKDTMNTVNNPASKLDDGNFQLNYIQEPDQITQNKYIVIYPYP